MCESKMLREKLFSSFDWCQCYSCDGWLESSAEDLKVHEIKDAISVGISGGSTEIRLLGDVVCYFCK